MYDCIVVFNLTLFERMGGKSGWMALLPGTAVEISVIQTGTQESAILLSKPGM